MVGKLIEWATHSVVVVLLLAVALAAVGGYAFVKVNVEAYPDPAPAIIEIVAQYPGASAEEVERQVTIPLEVALAGMPGLKYTRAKSMFGLAHVRNQFEYGIEYLAARQEVVNRLSQVTLPNGVQPKISPASPIGEILRYTLSSPKDRSGNDIYTLNDLKALQDWMLEREFRRVERVAGVTSSGGTVKRYEIQPDPDLLKKNGLTLAQLQHAIADSNANVGGDYVVQGSTIQVVRCIGLIGGGEDPMQVATQADTPAARQYDAEAQQLEKQGKKDLALAKKELATIERAKAAAMILRKQENRRLMEIRNIVIAATNSIPIRVEHVVDGGPIRADDKDLGKRGVIVSHQTRQGQLGITRPKQIRVKDDEWIDLCDAHGNRIWYDEDDKVQGIILLRKGEQSIPALVAVKAKVAELNDPSLKRLLPGVTLDVYYDRARLIDVTTETVHENLFLGMIFVTGVLLLFLNNVRCAVIVALNIPLALLFAFCVLYLRGKSANLLSIGAVDFGIIVDSSVIMVENIYRRLSSGVNAELPLRERIVRASHEVQRSLLYSTIIMICAMLPLFTMQGPEGQIFGPMADTYAFALAGALVLSLTVSPVLCLLLFKNPKPSRDNFLVRSLKALALWNLEGMLRHRRISVAFFILLAVGTIAALPFLGREFMPELEEGNMIVRGTFPVNASLSEVTEKAKLARHILSRYPEIRLCTAQVGRPDDGTDPTGYYNVECFVPLYRPDQWAIPPGHKRPRTKAELINELNEELSTALPGISWDFSQMIRDSVMEALSGVKGENSVKIIGPDLNKLEELAESLSNALSQVDGIKDPGVFHIKGQTSLTFPVDREKCALWSVSVNDLDDVISTAVGGKPFTQMIEGEKSFDITLRWPLSLRETKENILDIPVDIVRNTITASTVSATSQSSLSSSSPNVRLSGTSMSTPSIVGSAFDSTVENSNRVPRRRLGDLVTPLNDDGTPDAHGSFLRPGASTIAREQSKRLIAVKFSVRGRDLASTVAEAQAKTADILKPPYISVWSGEFQQMREAEARMALIVCISLVLILIMLYLAFRSLLDAFVVYANVGVMIMGGIWTLFLTGINFNVSAAVGFISVLGVAVMNGLLMVSSFNHLRAVGLPTFEAIKQGTEKLVRPLTMIPVAAILGLLPAAVSTKIGSQSQRPLAMVVVGGMITTLIMFNLIPLLYSLYGDREPPEGAGGFEE